MKCDWELIVIGGGPGGMAAARAAARAGVKPLLVQVGAIGGDCTFTGCVPSKTVIEAAARGETFDDAMRAVRRTVETIAAGEDDDAFHREGIDVLHGWATFRGPNEIEVDGTILRSRRFVIATGTTAAVPAIDGLSGVDYLTNENVFELADLPASLAVLGGGAVGCELAQAFRRLGAGVTVIEALDRLLSREEPEASAVVADAFAAEGIELRTGRTLTRVEPLEAKGAVRLHLHGDGAVTADRLLVAVGRKGATGGLGLEAAGVATEAGFVRVDDRLATTTPGIWAVGDVTGLLQFTHAADEMGRVAVANALARKAGRRFNTGVPVRETGSGNSALRHGRTSFRWLDRRTMHGIPDVAVDDGSDAPATASTLEIPCHGSPALLPDISRSHQPDWAVSG